MGEGLRAVFRLATPPSGWGVTAGGIGQPVRGADGHLQAGHTPIGVRVPARVSMGLGEGLKAVCRLATPPSDEGPHWEHGQPGQGVEGHLGVVCRQAMLLALSRRTSGRSLSLISKLLFY